MYDFTMFFNTYLLKTLIIRPLYYVPVLFRANNTPLRRGSRSRYGTISYPAGNSAGLLHRPGQRYFPYVLTAYVSMLGKHLPPNVRILDAVQADVSSTCNAFILDRSE